MPKGKHISLSDKGAIVALRQEGKSLRIIGKQLGNIGCWVEKDRTEGLEEDHAVVPESLVRVNATSHASSTGRQRRTHEILIEFCYYYYHLCTVN